MILVCTFRQKKEIYLSFFSKKGSEWRYLTFLGLFFRIFYILKQRLKSFSM
jgi:hypothetical protein